MAETTNEKTAKTVKVRPEKRGEREDPNLFVGINGTTWIIPRGKTSEVPDYVAAEIERAKAAKEAFDDYKDARQSKA